MGRTYRFMALACLMACASATRGPEQPRVYENMDATQRIDIMPAGHGSAVVLTEDGYLLSNYHVSGKGDRTLLVNISEDGKPAVAYVAQVVVTDEKHDLAVLKIQRHFDRTVVMGSIDEVHPGDLVYNLGYPYDLGRMAGVGNVKAIGWNYAEEDKPDLRVENGLALDIPNGPGTSGSGIYAASDGKLVGLMQMVMALGPNDGRRVVVHVAVPVDTIRAFLDRAHIRYHTALQPSSEACCRDHSPPS